LVIGGEKSGFVRLALGESGRSYLREIAALIAAHPATWGRFSPIRQTPAQEAGCRLCRPRCTTTSLRLHAFAETGNRAGLLELIAAHPQYLRLQTHDLQQRPGIPSLAVQVWLTR